MTEMTTTDSPVITEGITEVSHTPPISAPAVETGSEPEQEVEVITVTGAVAEIKTADATAVDEEVKAAVVDGAEEVKGGADAPVAEEAKVADVPAAVEPKVRKPTVKKEKVVKPAVNDNKESLAQIKLLKAAVVRLATTPELKHKFRDLLSPEVIQLLGNSLPAEKQAAQPKKRAPEVAVPKPAAAKVVVEDPAKAERIAQEEAVRQGLREAAGEEAIKAAIEKARELEMTFEVELGQKKLARLSAVVAE